MKTRKFALGTASPHPGVGSPLHQKRGLALVYLASASGPASDRARSPGPALPPPRRRPDGGGVGVGVAGRRRRSAGRGGCAAGRAAVRGRGEQGSGEGAASPAPLQCPQPPSHSPGEDVALGVRGRDGNGLRPAVPRPPPGAGDRACPRGSRVWAPLPPQGTGTGNGRLSGSRRRSGSK